MKDYAKEYQEARLRELEAVGLTGLTEEQASVILEPQEAPENFYCDGEVSPMSAKKYWKQRLELSGLTPQQIKTAYYFIFKR